MKWQPIETAPDDDTPKLGWGIWQGEIHGICETPGVDIITTISDRTDYDNGGGWWNCATGDAYATWLKATHWMPLPEPPQ